jgi:hypothetical protein
MLEIHARQENLNLFGPILPSSSPPGTLPSVDVRQPQFSFCLPLRLFACVSREPKQLPLLASIHSEISPSAIFVRH